MDAKYTVTIKADDEGFLGSDPDAIAKVDPAASWENYTGELRKVINEEIPEIINLSFEYGPYGGQSIKVLQDDPVNYEKDETEWIYDQIQSIEERIYNLGTFWVDRF